MLLGLAYQLTRFLTDLVLVPPPAVSEVLRAFEIAVGYSRTSAGSGGLVRGVIIARWSRGSFSVIDRGGVA